MTKMVMNGIGAAICVAGIIAIDIAERKALNKVAENFVNNLHYETRKPEDRWVKVKVRDVK